MSQVTNIILCMPLRHDTAGNGNLPPEINAWIEREEHQQGFVSLDSPDLPCGWYGGCKMLEADLYVGAFNYFNVEAFAAFLSTVPLDAFEPIIIQLIVQEQDDDKFRIIEVTAPQSEPLILECLTSP